MQYIFLFGTTLAVSVLCENGVLAEDQLAFAQLKSKLVTVKRSDKAGKLYLKFFAKTSTRQLKELKHDADLGVALHAAWRMHNVKQDVMRFGGAPPLDPGHGNRFIGFFEGRTLLTPPDWWSGGVLDPAFGAVDRMEAEAKYYDPYPCNFPAARMWGSLQLPPRTTLSKKGQKITARVRGESVQLPASLFREVEDEDEGYWSRAIIDIGPIVSLVVFHLDAVTDPFPIYCVDSRTSKIMWRAKSWGAGEDNIFGFSGTWSNTVGIERHGKHLAVYGHATSGSYVEVFSLKTGECKFRFSTNFWNAEIDE